MKDLLRPLAVFMVGVFLFGGFVMPYGAQAQAESVTVMTLANGQTINMTQAQLQSLLAQPGITLSTTPVITASQIAVPLPASLGGGYIIAEPAALAAGLNATGISSGLMATSFAGATAGTGPIAVGSVAGAAMQAGVGAGVIAAGAGLGAAVLGGAAAALGGGGGGGGGDAGVTGGTTTTHTTTSHH